MNDRLNDPKYIELVRVFREKFPGFRLGVDQSPVIRILKGDLTGGAKCRDGMYFGVVTRAGKDMFSDVTLADVTTETPEELADILAEVFAKNASTERSLPPKKSTGVVVRRFVGRLEDHRDLHGDDPTWQDVDDALAALFTIGGYLELTGIGEKDGGILCGSNREWHYLIVSRDSSKDAALYTLWDPDAPIETVKIRGIPQDRRELTMDENVIRDRFYRYYHANAVDVEGLTEVTYERSRHSGSGATQRSSQFTEKPMSNSTLESIDSRLLAILREMKSQTALSHHFGERVLPFSDLMDQIQEYIAVGECGIAYEVIVATLEQVPFMISGRSAVSLVEVTLLLGYKTEDPNDRIYDRR